MKIRRLWVSNYRGIRECDWIITSDLLCLVGPGDSTKTSLLDALGLLFTRNNYPRMTDADFYNCDPQSIIEIRAAITDLPQSLLREDAFGLQLSGIDENGEILPEPMPGSETCLLIQVTVDSSLEPYWEVVREDSEEPKQLRTHHRKDLGFYRLGENPENHLKWSRLSALTAMFEARSAAGTIILDAHRQARETIFNEIPEDFKPLIGRISKAARELGSGQGVEMRAGLEPYGLSTGSALALHHGAIPLANFGTGTKRITALSIQERATAGNAVLAIDEVEHGLEPHRLYHLLRHLKDRTGEGKGQVFLTTHSPIAVETLQATELSIVRSCGGQTTVTLVPDTIDNIQGVVRTAPSALLARTIIVGEGETEVGFARCLLTQYSFDKGRFTQTGQRSDGIGFVSGGGTRMFERANAFHLLGYRVIVLMDNDDRSQDKDVDEARKQGIEIVRCSTGQCIEEELITCLNPATLDCLLRLVLESHDLESVTQRISNWVPAAQVQKGLKNVASVDNIADFACGVAKVAAGRKQNGQRETNKCWFKSQSGGEQLGHFVTQQWDSLSDTSMGRLVHSLIEQAQRTPEDLEQESNQMIDRHA